MDFEVFGIAEKFWRDDLDGGRYRSGYCGQTFYMFSVENLKQFFATLKAIGISNWVILRIIMTQALFVSTIGYCIGIGRGQNVLCDASTQLSGGLRGIFASVDLCWLGRLHRAGDLAGLHRECAQGADCRSSRVFRG